MPSTKLQVDIYQVPSYRVTTGFEDEDRSTWPPTSCVLVHGPHSAALIDCPATIEQGKVLAKWIAETIPTKKLKYVYTTHAHPDHFSSVPVLQEHFPEAEFVAMKHVVAGIKDSYATSFEQIWPTMFNNDIHLSKPVPKALPNSGDFYLDGHKVQGIEVGHTDNEHSSIIHVPSLDLVVTGDIVYGDNHQYFGEANTPKKRKEWLDALDLIESLQPRIVVAGHKRSSQADAPYLIESTKEYIHTFEKELVLAKSPEALFDRMKELYPARKSFFILHFSCQKSFAARESKL